jgi:hypothetical protein
MGPRTGNTAIVADQSYSQRSGSPRVDVAILYQSVERTDGIMFSHRDNKLSRIGIVEVTLIETQQHRKSGCSLIHCVTFLPSSVPRTVLG